MLEKIGALWRSEQGKKSVMSGQPSGLLRVILPEGARLVVLKNDRKEGSQPDYELYIGTEDEKKPTTKDHDPNF